jgi:hypothetical protein
MSGIKKIIPQPEYGCGLVYGKRPLKFFRFARPSIMELFNKNNGIVATSPGDIAGQIKDSCRINNEVYNQ